MVMKMEKRMDEFESRISHVIENLNKVLSEFNSRIDSIEKGLNDSSLKAAPEKKEEKQETLRENEEDGDEKGKDNDFKPGDIKIEDYFNFSNAKFN